MIGVRVETLNFGWAECVSEVKNSTTMRNRGGKIDVRFDDTGNVRKDVVVNSFLSGNVRDATSTKPFDVGSVFNTSSYGSVEVVEIISSKSITIKFTNTGNIYNDVEKDLILTGYLIDHDFRNETLIPQKKEQEEKSNLYKIKIENCRHREKAREERLAKKRIELAEKKAKEEENKLKFLQEQKQRKLEQVANAEISITPSSGKDIEQNPNDLNIDFKDRDGKWVLRFSRTQGGCKNFTQTRLGRLHNNMMQRANPGGSFQSCTKSYLDVSVAECFKDPQKFCDWVVQQEGWGYGYNLDKDLLVKGNKEYHPDKCVFLPPTINIAIAMKRVTNKSSIVRKLVNGEYRVTCHTNNLKIFLGDYPSESDAISAYKKYREDYVRKLAEDYKDRISIKAYDALLKWTFDSL